MTDSKFLQWIHDRLVNVHGENPNYDYMIKLRKTGEGMEPDFSELDSLPPEPHGGKAHIFRSELSGEWYLRLLAANGEIIMASEGHKNLDDLRMLWDKYFPLFALSDEHGEPI